jgi:hypothetical protein
MKPRIVVTLVPDGALHRIVSARCQCGNRSARIGVGGWWIRHRRSPMGLVARSAARNWIGQCFCMTAKGG